MLLTKYSQVVLFCLRQRSMRFILLCCVPKLYYTYSGFSELEINNDKLLSPFCVRHEPQINEIPSYHKEYLTSNNKIWRPHQKTLHNHNESDFDSSDSYYGAAYSYPSHPNWYLLPSEQCGNSMSMDRIVGGKQAELGQYPWMARIGYTIKCRSEVIFQCAGTLINKLYVLTAAHCVSNLPTVKCPGNTTHSLVVSAVRLGENYVDKDPDCDKNICAEPVQDFAPMKIIYHKNYGKPVYRNDIALIRLDRPAQFNGWVAPICMPSGRQLEKNYVGEIAEVAGFGLYDVARKLSSNVLLTLKVPIRGSKECIEAYEKIAEISNKQICAGGVIGEDSCGGDSGGPLMYIESVDTKPPRYYLLGVVSFGTTLCGSTTQPGIYTRTAAYLKWILDNILP